MGCTGCKKKHIRKEQENLPNKKSKEVSNSIKKPINFDVDRIMTWIIVIWFFFGIYGIYSLIKIIINWL